MDVPLIAPQNTTIAVADLEDAFYSVIQTEIALFVQGANVLLVGVALAFLHQRRPAGACILGSLISVMCALTTTTVILDGVVAPLALRTMYSAATPSASLQRMKAVLTLVEDLLVVTNNATADALLIYRCHVMWKNSKHRTVVLLPAGLALVTIVAGYVLSCQGYPAPSPGPHPDLRIFYALVCVTNATLIGLIVGPILRARRSLRPTGQTRFMQRYNSALKILLEYAVIYLLGSSAAIVQQSLPALSTPTGNLCGLVFQTLMNMVPALAVLQISFGHARPAEGCPCKSGVSM